MRWSRRNAILAFVLGAATVNAVTMVSAFNSNVSPMPTARTERSAATTKAANRIGGLHGNQQPPIVLSTVSALRSSSLLLAKFDPSAEDDPFVISVDGKNNNNNINNQKTIRAVPKTTTNNLPPNPAVAMPPSPNLQIQQQQQPKPKPKRQPIEPKGWLRTQYPSIQWDRLPNFLTYARCFAVPVLMMSFYTKFSCSHLLTGGLFAMASFTDWLDGYLARRWNVTSAFGSFLDPVADKLMVSTALILLSGRHGAIVAIPTSIILAREIAVSALREWMAQRSQRDIVKVGIQGKIKTALTMVALSVLLFVPSGTPLTTTVIKRKAVKSTATMILQSGIAMLYLSALVTVTSGSVYFRAAAPILFEKRNTRTG